MQVLRLDTKVIKNNDKKCNGYFDYIRKSTTDERQVLSLESQEEVMKKVANEKQLKIVRVFKESRSAKEPNKRPIFSEMISRIKDGEADGIICWELSRLARNPDEAGLIIGMLQRGEIKHIKTYGKDYYSDDNSVISFVEFGIANQFSRDLSKNVKRGIDKKAAMGWRSGRAPLGYLNSKKELKGEQYIYNDPDRYNIVRQLLRTMLTGNYTAPQLHRYAIEDLKLRALPFKKRASRPIHLSEMYRILINPFYYGWYEWPNNSGNWLKGKHEPMISEEEYDRIQFLLGRDGRPRSKKHKFAFTGLMRCGSCGAMVTAHEKFKKQMNGNVHHYIYYHCTKRLKRDCIERSIEIHEFNKQVDDALKNLTIPERFQKWAIKYLHEIRKEEAKTRDQVLANKHEQYEKLTQQLENLVLTYTSLENSGRNLMTEEEYSTVRSKLLKTKSGLENELKAQGKELEKWVELSERTFNFALYARIWFAKGDLETKRAIFACLGSNLVLKGQIVAIDMRKPFKLIVEGLSQAKEELERLEPLINSVDTNQFHSFSLRFPILSGYGESNPGRQFGKLPYCHYTIPAN